MSLSVELFHRLPGLELDVKFHAPAGITALFGRSGAGKTTVTQAVAGLFRPDRARIQVDDVVLTETERGIFLPPHHRKIGYVFQDARLFPHMTVRQNLTYGRWFHRGPKRADFDQIVGLLGVEHLLPRMPKALSGGEKSRVALGRAILSEPRFLLLDEPMAALDEARKQEVLPYLERLRDELGIPMLYVSHSMAEVARLATTMVLMESGRVISSGPVAEVMTNLQYAPVVGLREAGALLLAPIGAQEADGLTRLTLSSGDLFLPQIRGAIGETLRLRILAQDVMIAVERPAGISALNILSSRVGEIRLGAGPGALVRLDLADGQSILSRVTRRSAQALGLTQGLPVYAIIKAVSVAQENIGA